VASTGAQEAEGGKAVLPKIADISTMSAVTHEQLYWAANTMHFLQEDASSNSEASAEGGAEAGVGPAASGVEVAAKAQGSAPHFNFFGFFGCCYKCKHEPACTSKCMEAHHIPNGYDEAQAEEEHASESYAAEDYKQAAEVLEFIQIAASSKPAADQTVRPGGNSKKSQDLRAAKKAGLTLNNMSSENQKFRIHQFFDCVFGCHHEIPCSKQCLSRHHIPDHYVKHQIEEYQLEADEMHQQDLGSGDDVKTLDL